MRDFAIIDDNYESRRAFGFNYGYEDMTITKAELQALIDGKALATDINCGEYSLFIKLSKCVDCDECEHRSEDCLCDISNNEDECPLIKN